MGLFDSNKIAFEFDFGTPTETKEVEPEQTDEKKTKRRTTVCTVRSDRHLYLRAFSETQPVDVTGFDFKDGESYHCITGGDVDALLYLKVILRQQDLDYCLFSTWVMAAEDILFFDEMLTAGRIKKLDAYMGEIFTGSYKIEHQMLKDIFEKHGCGRIAVFKNHSKIFAGYGSKFYFGVETSANINTNPRCENGCITIGKGIFEFYKSYFDKINSFE